jgi:sn-glycerol 3-phosphate transport system substrate-binding protein
MALGEFSAEAAGKTQVTFWYSITGRNGEYLASMAEKFNATPEAIGQGIEIHAVSQGDYYQNATKLQSSIVSGTQPDMTLLEVAQVGEFGYSGALADLREWFTREEIADYIEGLMKNSWIDEKLVAIPFNRSTPILYINRTLLREAGLDERGPRNWDELRDFARKLTDPERGISGFSTPIDIWFYEAGVFQQGGTIFNADETEVAFNSPEGIAIIQLWQEMVREGIMKAPVGQDYNAWDVVNNDLATGKTAMGQISTASLSGLLNVTKDKFDLGTAFLPAGEKSGVPTGGACLVILDKAPQTSKKAAAAFIKYLTNTENAAAFSEISGYMPATHSAVQSERIQKLYTQYPQYEVAYRQLEHANTRPMRKGYREMSVIMQEEFKKAMRDTSISPQEVVESAARKVQELIDEQ